MDLCIVMAISKSVVTARHVDGRCDLLDPWVPVQLACVLCFQSEHFTSFHYILISYDSKYFQREYIAI